MHIPEARTPIPTVITEMGPAIDTLDLVATFHPCDRSFTARAPTYSVGVHIFLQSRISSCFSEICSCFAGQASMPGLGAFNADGALAVEAGLIIGLRFLADDSWAIFSRAESEFLWMPSNIEEKSLVEKAFILGRWQCIPQLVKQQHGIAITLFALASYWDRWIFGAALVYETILAIDVATGVSDGIFRLRIATRAQLI